MWGKLTGHLPVCGWLRVATAFEVHSKCCYNCMRWWSTRLSPVSNAGGNHYKSISGGPISWWLVCGRTRRYSMGRCKLSCHRCCHWKRHIHSWKCKLVATGTRGGRTHKPGKVRWGFEGLTPGSVIEGKCDSPAGRFEMCTQLDFRHFIRDKGAHQSSVRNVNHESTNHPSGIGLEIWTCDRCNASEIPREPSRSIVSQWWLDEIQKKTEPIEPACAVASNGLGSTRIRNTHQFCGHPGAKCTLYFVKMVP